MIPQIAYTHTNCSDVWEMFIGQNREHTALPLCIVSNEEPDDLLLESFVLYSDAAPYYRVWTDAVKAMDSEFFIYLQEDFVLYADVNEDGIEEYVSFLDDNPEYSFVRLLRATSFKNKKLTDTLYEIESKNKNVFSMQPTIWRSSDYIRLMDAVREKKWLETPAYREKVIEIGMKGAYHYDGEELAGKHHYNSNVYPYIATALVKGKWNMSEYGVELEELFDIYDINPDHRGTI